MCTQVKNTTEKKKTKESGEGALEETLQLKDSAYQYRDIFARFITVRKKQILARAIGIQKENW